MGKRFVRLAGLEKERGGVKGEVAIDGRPGLCAFSFQLLTTWSLHLSLQATSGFHAATL